MLVEDGANADVADRYGSRAMDEAEYWAMNRQRSGSEDTLKFAEAIRLLLMYGGKAQCQNRRVPKRRGGQIVCQS